MVTCYLCKKEANANCSNCNQPICSVHTTTVTLATDLKAYIRCKKCAKDLLL